MAAISCVDIPNYGSRNSMTSQPDALRILCFGMGAIGTYIGGSLAHTGCEVVFIEHTNLVNSSKLVNLRIQIGNEEILVPNIEVEVDLKSLLAQRKFDIALLAVKSFDTLAVVNSLIDIKDRIPPILCLQNGVENELLIEEKLGRGSVISGTITSAIGRIGLGDVRLEKLRGVGIETGTPLSGKLIEVFTFAGLNARGYPNREEMKWSKMLTNLQVNATSAILNWTPSQVLANPITYRIEVRQLREALAVMKQLGIKIIDLPGTPVRLLVNSLTSFPLWLGRTIIGRPLAKARGAKMPSFQIDLQAGRICSEVEYLNGAVVRFGEKNGIPTPVNRILTSTLVDLAAGKLMRNTFFDRPDLLYKKIEEIS